jgi:hypothetical protein
MLSLATSKSKRPSAQPPDPNIRLGFGETAARRSFFFACGILANVYFCVGFSDAGNDVTLHALMRPASEKRQGTKSREVGQRWCSERYGDYMLAPIWNCARNASTTSPACLQQVRSGECNSGFVARSERNSGPSAH